MNPYVDDYAARIATSARHDGYRSNLAPLDAAFLVARYGVHLDAPPLDLKTLSLSIAAALLK